MAVKRGEIWLADLSPTKGSEQSGTRPVLIVQTDRANPHSPHTVIVPFTTRIRRKMLPSHVLIPAGEGGLSQDSVILAEQVRVVDGARLIKKIGALSNAYMQEANDALRTIRDL